jgi:hypothetical protein
VPVGVVEPAQFGEAGFTAYFRKDFLLPELDDPDELVYGIPNVDEEAEGLVDQPLGPSNRLPFADNVPLGYYEMTLGQARRLLSSNGNPLVSIKVRPLQYWPTVFDRSFHNAYVYEVDYAEIDSFLSRRFATRGPVEPVPQGRAQVYTPRAPDGGAEFAFVQHESGPEIIVCLGSAQDSPGLMDSVLDVVRETMLAVKRSNESWKSQGKNSGRYYPVAAISIEERREESAHILTVIPIHFDESDLQRVLRRILAPALG